jgi:hypothetical protein
MNPRKATAILSLILIHPLAFADASYQASTQITGGSLVDTLKQVSFLSHSLKDMLAPTSTLTVVHGNQKAVVSKDFADITDLDKQYMLHVDNLKHTYTITTFAQMRQAFANMPQQMQKMQAQMKQAQASQPHTAPPADIKTTFDVKVDNTGVSRVVNGLNAQEQIITLTMHVTATPTAGQPVDPNAPTSLDYTVTTDAWVAPEPPQLKEIADFDRRMGQILMQGVDMKAFADQMKQMQSSSNAAIAQLMGGKPGASEAMAQMAKEVAKLKGTRVLEITSMGSLVPAGSVTASTASNPNPNPNAQSIAGQIATNTATQTAAGEASQVASKFGIFGAALNNSAFSAFHRKKSTPPPPPPAPTPAPATTASTTPGMQTVVLMTTTTQQSNFSDASVSPSIFQVPSGYRQVESPLTTMAQ